MTVSTFLDRDQFLQWLGGSLIPRATSGIPSARFSSRAGDVLLVWSKDAGPPSLANTPLISLPSDRMQEFFAFTSTYVRTYVPFSAFFRVIPFDILDDLISDAYETKRRDIVETLVATTIAEAYIQIGGARPLSQISVQACLATASSCALAALWRRYHDSHIERVILDWGFARESLALDTTLRLSADAALGFWLPLLHILLGRSGFSSGNRRFGNLMRFVNSMLVGGGVSSETKVVEEITENLPDSIRSVFEKRDGSREDQVRSIDRITDALINDQNVEPLVREIVAGFLISRVSGGDIEYLGLCDPFLKRMPRAALWFAVFLTSKNEDSVLAASDCLGRKVARQLYVWPGLFSPPVGDIGIEELRARKAENRTLLQLRLEQQSVIPVELLPGVTARYRNPREQIPPERDTSVKVSATHELRSLLRRAVKLADDLDVSRSLFGDERRGKGGKRS